ncbi:MAG: hypothetical protein ACJ8KA_05460 [Sulfurifustis sp.]
MGLELSVPDNAATPFSDLELDPERVERWLAGLPLLDSSATGGKLYANLQAYNRADVPADIRLALLERYRAPVRHLTLELRKHYVGVPLPLGARQQATAEQSRHFALELAYGYKHVVLANSQLPGGRRRDAIESALPLQRAIRYLTETLLASFLSYAPAPAKLWREIHTLYAHAERFGITTVEVPDNVNGIDGRGTVARAYKHALLLDLGDPYHLPSPMIVKMDQYLENYADRASLRRGVGQTEPNCHFLIDLESDRAGILHSKGTILQRADRYGLLDTVELARHIHSQLKQLQDGQVPASRLPPDFYRAGGHELLLRLINVWGINPKRTFRRSQRTNTGVEVAVGLDAIGYWLNGGRRFLPSSRRVGPFRPQDEAREPSAQAAEPEYALWNIEDESAGGMSMSHTGELRRRVAVGDVVATRFTRDDPWTINAVRWVRSPNPAHVEIGTERLAPAAVPVAIKVVADDNAESDFLAALLLPPIPALKQPQTLVTPRSVFRPQRALVLDNGTKLRRLIAQRLVEAAQGFERIEFIEAS